MNQLEEYQKNQVELTRKIIFEKEKEVLRATAQTLAKNNHELTFQNITMQMDIQKLVDVIEKQKVIIENYQKT